MSRYLRIIFNVPILGLKSSMPNASAEGITIIKFWDGKCERCYNHGFYCQQSCPKAVLFLGKCGGLKRAKCIRGLCIANSGDPR